MSVFELQLSVGHKVVKAWKDSHATIYILWDNKTWHSYIERYRDADGDIVTVRSSELMLGRLMSDMDVWLDGKQDIYCDFDSTDDLLDDAEALP